MNTMGCFLPLIFSERRYFCTQCTACGWGCNDMQLAEIRSARICSRPLRGVAIKPSGQHHHALRQLLEVVEGSEDGRKRRRLDVLTSKR